MALKISFFEKMHLIGGDQIAWFGKVMKIAWESQKTVVMRSD